ncbi:hypothetical protein D3C71_1497720 [compost metagenome]
MRVLIFLIDGHDDSVLHWRIFDFQRVRNLFTGVCNVITVDDSIIYVFQRYKDLGRVQNFNINVVLVRLHAVDVKVLYTCTLFNLNPSKFFQNSKCAFLVNRIIRNSNGSAVFNIIECGVLHGVQTLRRSRHIGDSNHVRANFFIDRLHVRCALEDACINRAFLHGRVDLHVLGEGFNINLVALLLQNRQNRLAELLFIGSNTKSNGNLFLLFRRGP